jgi:hypothetical protein
MEVVMHSNPHILQYLVLTFIAVFVGSFSYSFRKEIRFRWNFGMWPREEGVDKIVTRRLEAVFAAKYDAVEAVANASEAVRNCSANIVTIRENNKALKKLQQKSDYLQCRMDALCQLADHFNFQWAIKAADEGAKRSKGLWVVPKKTVNSY